MSPRLSGTLALLAALCCAAALAPSAAAPRAVTTQATLASVATGLDNPRGMAFGPDGALYVAEAGRGGPGACRTGPEGGTECYGPTGAVSRITLGATPTRQRFLTGLPSLAAQSGPQAFSGATGPHDVAFLSNGDMFVPVGFGGPPISRTAVLSRTAITFGELVKVSANDALPRADVDIAAYEQSVNPDSQPPDTNPYAVVALRDWRAVIDAGGNSLLAVLPDDTVLSATVFPTQTISFPPGLPFGPPPGTPFPIQSVPTSVAIGPDGAYYVGELTGFPWPVGAARVYRVVPGRSPEVFASGFTNIIDLAFDSAGNLYVLEIAARGLREAQRPGGDPTGRLVRYNPAEPNASLRATTVISTGLVLPTGLALSPSGGIYVANNGIFPGQGGPLSGSVVRVDTCAGAPGCTEPRAAEAPFSAVARGANEVNAQGVPNQGDPDGIGPAIFTLDPVAGRVCVQAVVANIAQPTGAHIHRGAAGTNGPIVVPFDPLISGNTISGCVTVAPALVQEIRANPAGFYLNVHNQPFPAGAIRDQLAPANAGVSTLALPNITR